MINDQRLEFMQMAIDLATENASSQGGGPFGAVIVKDGEIISSSGNSVTPDKDPTAHAEVNAIRMACKKLDTFDLSGCILYTSCEPCPMCLSAAYWAKIDKIYYAANRNDAAKVGFSDAFIYDQLTVAIEDRTLPSYRILEDKGLEPFNLWLKNENKTPY